MGLMGPLMLVSSYHLRA